MGSAFDDLPILQHQHLVRVADGAEAMGDDEGGAPGHQLLQRRLNLTLGAGVHAAGGLVQDEDAGIGQHGPGDGEKLALALAQARAPLAQHGVITLGQSFDEIVGVGQFGRGHHLFIAGVGSAKADVVHHRVVEEEGVLQHDADLAPQAGQGHIPHVDAVDAHRPLTHIVKAGDEADDGGLARARGAHQGHGLARVCMQAHISQHRLARIVLGPDVIEFDLTLDGRHLHGVGLLHHVGFFIQKVEDALGTGDGALQIRPQDGDLPHGLVEALGVAQKGDDEPQGDQRAADGPPAQQQQPAHGDDDGDSHVAQGLQHRRQSRCVAHGLDVGVPIGCIADLEGLDVHILAAEGLHLAHCGDVFLQLGVDVADLLAGDAEGLAGLGAEPPGGDPHQGQHRHAHQGVGPVQGKHLPHDPHQQDDGAEHLHHAHANHLLDGAGVVGETAHDVARIVLCVV